VHNRFSVCFQIAIAFVTRHFTFKNHMFSIFFFKFRNIRFVCCAPSGVIVIVILITFALPQTLGANDANKNREIHKQM